MITDYFIYSDKEIAYLSNKDAKLGDAIKRIGKIERKVNPELFPAIINHIVGQQISTVAQSTIWERLKNILKIVNPENIVNCDDATLQSCGLSFRKVEYIKDFANKVHDGSFVIDDLVHMNDIEIIEKLSALRGIGVWTAEMLLIFCLQRPNIVSYGDLAILRGMRMLYGYKQIDKTVFNHHAKLYSPHGSVASLYLWAIAGGALPELHDPAPPTKPVKSKDKAAAQPNKKAQPTELLHAYYTNPHGTWEIKHSLEYIHSIKKANNTSNEHHSTPLTENLFQQLDEYFSGKRKSFDFPTKVEGTEFQKKVWNALCDIPYGETRSYKDIAEAIDSPKAYRAVGLANNKNPISIAVPCHRVIGSNGKMVGYAGGLNLKETLLALETKHK